jgi:hypothetical protein
MGGAFLALLKRGNVLTKRYRIRNFRGLMLDF